MIRIQCDLVEYAYEDGRQGVRRADLTLDLSRIRPGCWSGEIRLEMPGCRISCLSEFFRRDICRFMQELASLHDTLRGSACLLDPDEGQTCLYFAVADSARGRIAVSGRMRAFFYAAGLPTQETMLPEDMRGGVHVAFGGLQVHHSSLPGLIRSLGDLLDNSGT